MYCLQPEISKPIADPVMPVSLFYLLLIDDDEDDLEMLTSSFLIHGLPTKSFTSGPKAISYLHHSKGLDALPQLIIMDYNMPGADGQAMLRLLKADKELQHIPVVIYSTTVTLLLRTALMALGAYECMAKPYSLAAHNHLIERFMSLVYSFKGSRQSA